MHKERKETTHVRVGERNIHQHIKKISTIYVYKWSQGLMYNNNVSKKEKKRYIISSLHPSKINTPPNENVLY